jgi:putative addiction module component (TIGR02574 family)
MAVGRKNLEDQALKLPVRARAQLAQRLIASLDGEPYPNGEGLWLIEAKRRAAELSSGKVKGIPAAKVFKKARSALG